LKIELVSQSRGLLISGGSQLASLFNLVLKFRELLADQAQHLASLYSRLLHLSELSTHYPELHKCRDSVRSKNSSGYNLKNVFPNWRLIGTAVLWGWLNN
jgi:hypothetical protein